MGQIEELLVDKAVLDEENEALAKQLEARDEADMREKEKYGLKEKTIELE